MNPGEVWYLKNRDKWTIFSQPKKSFLLKNQNFLVLKIKFNFIICVKILLDNKICNLTLTNYEFEDKIFEKLI